MNFDEFESQARLYIVGALEGDELAAFQATRRIYGERAEQVIAEFRKLNSVFALSLQPHPPHPETKRKILQAIREAAQRMRWAGTAAPPRHRPSCRPVASGSACRANRASKCLSLQPLRPARLDRRGHRNRRSYMLVQKCLLPQVEHPVFHIQLPLLQQVGREIFQPRRHQDRQAHPSCHSALLIHEEALNVFAVSLRGAERRSNYGI